MADCAPSGDLPITPLPPLRISQERQDGAPLVFIRSTQPVLRVCAGAEQDSIATGSLPHISGDCQSAQFLCGVNAMKAIRQPVFSAVIKHNHRGKLILTLHCLSVFADHGIIQTRARLCAAI
jgi:hypothetical protein